MPENIENLSFSSRCQFDEIIDVRSPAEYAEDHIPGAVNLPVLSDAERHEVGKIYCQESRHEARRIGAAYITKNVSHYLQQYFSTKNSAYQPLVYCWRGGMRSQSIATILNSVGWYTKVIAGGYKTWRHEVVSNLRESELAFPLILIDGQTGTSKTKILNKLNQLGHQTLDLEDLAKHRGSVFGSFEEIKQPSQKYFESTIYDAFSQFDPQRPVFLEAESPKIGRRAIPHALVKKMRTSPRIELRASAEIRAANLLTTYADLINTPERIVAALEYLRPYHAASSIQHWQLLVAQKSFGQLALELIESHYDPCYQRQRQKHREQTAHLIELKSLDDKNLTHAAREIGEKLASFGVSQTSQAVLQPREVSA